MSFNIICKLLGKFGVDSIRLTGQVYSIG